MNKGPDIQKAFDIDDYLYFYRPMLSPERSDKETEFLIKALDMRAGDSVLDVCCGFGRHTNRLASRGMKVTGLDISEGFLQIARQEAEDLANRPQYILSDMRNISFSKEFDHILSLFTSFGYYDDETNLKIIKTMRKALKDNGQFCIETINRDTLLKNFKECIYTEIGENIQIDRSCFDSVSGRITTRRLIYLNRQFKIKDYFIRVYNPSEITLLLKCAGFKNIKLYAGFQNDLPDLSSMRLLAIAS